VQRVNKEENWDNKVGSVWESVKERDSWKRVGKDLSAEAEESPVLEAVDRKSVV
jgi:hypothetical protein